MMISLETISERARELTIADLKRKTIFELFAKMSEEVGEFSRELQIEEAVFGNNHKKPDEGSLGEAIDMIIMGLALYHARHPHIGSSRATEELPERLLAKLNKWSGTQRREIEAGLQVDHAYLLQQPFEGANFHRVVFKGYQGGFAVVHLAGRPERRFPVLLEDIRDDYGPASKGDLTGSAL